MSAQSQRSARPRVLCRASDLELSDRYCTKCGTMLRGKVAMLELDQRTDRYHDFGDVPNGDSQGWFPFGMDCARILLSQAIADRETAS